MLARSYLSRPLILFDSFGYLMSVLRDGNRIFFPTTSDQCDRARHMTKHSPWKALNS